MNPCSWVSFCYQVGWRDEPDVRSGLASLVPRLMVRATTHLAEGQYDRALDAAGATGSIWRVEPDRTCFKTTVPAAEVALPLWLWSDQMGFLSGRLDQRLIDQQIVTVKNEQVQRIENTPLGHLADIQNARIYPPGHPYRAAALPGRRATARDRRPRGTGIRRGAVHARSRDAGVVGRLRGPGGDRPRAEVLRDDPAWARHAAPEKAVEISDADGLEVRFQSVLPRFAAKHAFSGEPRCANEVSFRCYGEKEYLAEAIPKLSGESFVRAVSSTISFRNEWRVGRDGLVNLVDGKGSQHWRIPKSADLVFAWLRDLGWTAERSPAGRLAEQIFKRLDGHPSVLANEKLLGLLEHMNGGTVRKNGMPADDNKVTDEREMTVGQVKGRLEEASNRGDLHGYLLSKEVFKVGLRVKCQNCTRHSWFSLEEIKGTLTCPKCLNAFPAVGNVDGGQWCYRTSGPFSVPRYAEGAYTVLLGLAFFGDLKMHSVQMSPAFSFTATAPNKKVIEADFAAFWRESRYGEIRDGLLFAECKTYNQFEKEDFDRMAYLANTFPGAVLVFCTLKKSLTPHEIAGISRIAKKGRKYWKAERPINPVLVLTGTELLSLMGPPYCWDDPGVRKKFDRADGLFEVCDATQQIHLKLPSWHDDWRKELDRRDERRARLRAEPQPPTSSPPAP